MLSNRTKYTSGGRWLSGPRPVVASDGQEFPSIKQAAIALETTVSRISLAIHGTKIGRYRTVVGLQWAAMDDKPKTWPTPLRRGRPGLCQASQIVIRPMFSTEIEVPERELFTTGQVAKLLGCTTSPITAAIRKGELKGSLTPGGHHRIRRDALIAWLPMLGLCLKTPPYTPDWVI